MAIRIRRNSSLVALALLSSGCAGVHLLDKAQLETATAAKTTYAEAKVEEVILDERRNLEAQLASELAIVRANYQLRLDYAFLRMADDDNRPMADSRVTRAGNRLNSLGFVADEEADADGDILNQTQKLRAYLIQEQLLALKGKKLQERSNFISLAASGKRPPKCAADLPEALPFLDELSGDQRDSAEINYKEYKKICKEALEKRQGLIEENGEIQSAYGDWQEAKKRYGDLVTAIKDRSAAVARAKAAHDKAVKNAGAGGEETQKKIQNAAEKLGKALKKAGGKAASLGILPEERIEALTTIVLAVASQGADDEAKAESLDTATLIAGQIPVIAGQIKAFRDSGRAPSVSALLIELRHQTILLDYEKEQQELIRQRAALHEERYKAYEEEAKQWLAFHDALCSYAVVLAGGAHPGKACDEFLVTLGQNSADCKLSGQVVPASGDCALAKSWKDTLGSIPNNKTAKRELYKALAAFSRAMAARAPQDEYEYRLIDLDHQEVVAANRSAIRAWDSLVKVPLDQIEAYHAAGIPPEKIAELLVTGLSLGAIGVGVNR